VGRAGAWYHVAMRFRGIALAAASLLLLAASSAAAAPVFCSDVGGSVGFGVSSFGSVRDWAPAAKQQYGADFRAIYVYILAGGMDDPANFETYYVRPFLDTAVQMGAAPVCTFYQLLDLGKAAGMQGDEATIVGQALQDPTLMRTYFDHFIWLLQIAADYPPPVVVHVEPDSWGFMMWAMGVEGNADPTSVPVQVRSSGHPDLASCASCNDDAAGLGHALVVLRDQYAPAVRLGWHASNFRTGTHPEVVASFYAQMGSWDLLVGEQPHVDPVPTAWWEPWDEAALQVNLQWMSVVSSSAGLPLLLWQMPIGTTDYHLIGNASDLTMLTRFAAAGAVGVLFEHQNFNNVANADDYRASGDFGTVPPADHADACGTAACMRQRVADYSAAPLPWPDGSICTLGGAGSGGGSGAGGPGAGGPGGSGQGGGCPPDCGAGSAADASEDSGCGCRLAGRPGSHGAAGFGLAGLLVLHARRRRRDSQGGGRLQRPCRSARRAS
jgi:MYXO-CTERM domain-containing protein